MPALLERVTVLCFVASYGVALALEVWRLVAPRPILRYLSLGFGAAGIIAHAVYLWVKAYPLVEPVGSLLFLALILAIFYFYGTIHHYHLAWPLFVLPVVLGLIAAAHLATWPEHGSAWFTGQGFWAWVHGVLVLLAAVGVCVGVVASVMYLVQVHRLQAKLPPGQGMKLWSLERIETMNRRAILLAFPLLTLGLIVGLALQWQNGSFLQEWNSPKILGALGLWVVFAILLYLRYGAHARGRQVAWLTLLAFVLMLFALVSPVHPFASGGGP